MTTSDGKTLADIKFDNVYEENTKIIIGTTLNEKDSIGHENLQYLPTAQNVKGLAYLNVDEDLLQGCTVDITYVFSVHNDSEVDRINKRLYNLRYKQDANGYEEYFDDDYTAAGTARNELYSKYYVPNTSYRTKDKLSFNGTDGYYGKYLGETYYSGKVGSEDIVAELKVDKILDYVDNHMTMETSKNAVTDQYWRTMTDEELKDGGLLSGTIYSEVVEKLKENGEILEKVYNKLIDVNGIAYDISEKHNLAISVDDRMSANDSNNMNKLLSIFLKPKVANKTECAGNIYMVSSKVLSGESETENMTYDNSSEIIQYTSVTGRVTRLGTTVGNLEMKTEGRTYEDDSDFTERVILTPPTGLEITKYYISLAMDQIIIVTICIGVIIVAIILKKNIKHISFKKFYK